jgi:hypothetical protein
MLGSLFTCGILFSMARKEEAPACLAPPHSDIKTYTLSDQPIARDLDFNQTLRQCAPCFETIMEMETMLKSNT